MAQLETMSIPKNIQTEHLEYVTLDVSPEGRSHYPLNGRGRVQELEDMAGTAREKHSAAATLSSSIS